VQAFCWKVEIICIAWPNAETLAVSLMPRIWLEVVGEAFVPSGDGRVRPFQMKAGTRLESEGESLQPVDWVAAVAALVPSRPASAVHSPMSAKGC